MISGDKNNSGGLDNPGLSKTTNKTKQKAKNLYRIWNRLHGRLYYTDSYLNEYIYNYWDKGKGKIRCLSGGAKGRIFSYW